MSIKTLHGIVIKGLCFLAILMPVCAQSTTANALQHPRDQIALQLGAIQMGYTAPFTLTGNISAPKMQQAVNALVMGRNSLNATVGAPAVQVQGAVDCPNVDTVEYRDQLYSAVEYVVTSPVVATIKGSATLANSKKVTLSTTKLTVPPSAWTIPVPYALEARSSADVEALAGNLTSTVSTVTGLSGNLTNLSTQVASIGGNLSNTSATVSTLSGNLTSAQNSIQALSGNLGNLTTSVSSVTSNTTEVKALVEKLDYLKKSLVAQGIVLDYSPSIVSTLASFNGTLAGLEFDGSNGIYIASNGEDGGGKIQKLSPQGVVTNFAGNDSNVPIDGTGSSALLPNPTSLRTDAAGNVYFIDGYTIRKVTPAGVVTTLAGSGSPGSADGTGAGASFSGLGSLTLDSAGNIYVADSYKIRKVTPAGVVTTLAGSGSYGSADGTGAAASFSNIGSLTLDSAGNIYVADSNKIRKVTPAGVVTTLAGSGYYGSTDGTGEASSFSGLGSLSLDSAGNIYVADINKIRKVTSAGVVTTLAGSGSYGSADGTGAAASFGGIGSLSLDSAGTIYVAESNKIRKVTPAGVVTTLAGSGSSGSADGTGVAASFSGLASLTLDSSGNIYVADINNYKIRKVTPTGVVTTLAGPGSSGSADGTGAAASFGGIGSLTLDSAGNIYVADGYKLRKVTPVGVVTTLAGGALPYDKDGTGVNARMGAIASLVKDATGNFYALDLGNNKIRKITPEGVVSTWAGSGSSGSPDAIFEEGSRLASDNSGNIYIVIQYSIKKITSQGVITNFAGNNPEVPIDGTGTSAILPNPTSLRTDSAGNVYFIDGYTIRKVTPAGVVTTLAGSGSSGSADGTGAAASFGYIGNSGSLTLDSAGNIYVADSNKIRKVTSAAVVTTLAGSGSYGSADGTGAAASFSGLGSLTLDSAGNIYVADSNKIRKVTSAGVVTTLAGSGSSSSTDGAGAAASFSGLGSLTLDSAGNIYVADNNKIRKVTPAGVVTTLAGSGSSGSTDGTGAAASFGYIGNSGSLTLDSAGNIYVADSNKIRKVTPAGVVTTLAGSGSYGSADGTGAAASFGYIGSLTLDSAGNIYVADNNNYKIRKVTPAGVVTTLAGGASPYGDIDGDGILSRFASISDFVLDGAGNFYLLTTQDGELGIAKIRKVTPVGLVTTIHGPGLYGFQNYGTEPDQSVAQSKMTMDSAGNIYVGYSINQIAKVTPNGVSTTFAGSGDLGSSVDGQGALARFGGICSLSVDIYGNIFVNENQRIRKVTSNGSVTTLAGKSPVISQPTRYGEPLTSPISVDNGSGFSFSFQSIRAMKVDGSGNLYVVDGPGESAGDDFFKVIKISPQ